MTPQSFENGVIGLILMFLVTYAVIALIQYLLL